MYASTPAALPAPSPAVDPRPSARQALSEEQFTRELEASIPHLRAFSRVICHSRETADDMVQETLLKAWNARNRYQRGTRFRAWIFTILRNTYITTLRRRKFEGTYVEDSEYGIPAPANQFHHVELNEMKRAITRLPIRQRETLLLVVMEGLSYAEAAEVCGCMIGTVKSRVARARTTLQQMLEGEPSVGSTA